MNNIPEVKLGLVAVSRDCFPKQLSRSRRDRIMNGLKKDQVAAVCAETIVENESDAVQAIEELRTAGANALVVYLGNFGPEGPETLLVKLFQGPAMLAAAAEESQDNLVGGRGDALCGLLNASYNLGLRNLRAYIPENPVGDAAAICDMIRSFIPVARAVIGVRSLKVISFGPRPFDFLACNAPIKGLYDLGATVQENSELDLLVAYHKHDHDLRIPSVVADMAAELGSGNDYPGILERLAQYELTLIDWYEANKGASASVVFANKCWPAFQTEFKFVPCYVNSRLCARGIPVACETDLYGALSEFILACAALDVPTLLDINNSVPQDLIAANPQAMKGYKPTDLVMNFHCGNTAMCNLKPGTAGMKYQLIMKSLLEPDGEPDITRGTLDGRLKPGSATLYRLQSTAGGQLRSYIAEGEVLDLDPQSFGSIGIFAIPEFTRFYRYVLIEKQYPHHAGVIFRKAGRALYAINRYLGVDDVDYNQPAGCLYPGENPFA
ncbi:MAG: fucose isomerase [Clostridiaceae bacterium]|nr:fucose isomerase [Clostridiaceae bacterium]